ncbi:MAG: hypothetical protein M1816_001556 [Peltula sp. TS41687]|nr:MAG: hypothetical protein M1816_001556 [Peltula sp. TS41687]
MLDTKVGNGLTEEQEAYFLSGWRLHVEATLSVTPGGWRDQFGPVGVLIGEEIQRIEDLQIENEKAVDEGD